MLKFYLDKELDFFHHLAICSLHHVSHVAAFEMM